MGTWNNVTLTGLTGCDILTAGMLSASWGLSWFGTFALCWCAGFGLGALWWVLGYRLRSQGGSMGARSSALPERASGALLGVPVGGAVYAAASALARGRVDGADSGAQYVLRSTTSTESTERTSLDALRVVGTGCGCGEPVDRQDRTAVRMLGGFWHRSCWLAEAERRRPGLEAIRRRNEDRLTVAELLLRQEERGGSGFDVLGRPGPFEGMLTIIRVKKSIDWQLHEGG
jgi:hypothetical protein